MTPLDQLRSKLLAAQSLINEATVLMAAFEEDENLKATHKFSDRLHIMRLVQAIITTVGNYFGFTQVEIQGRCREQDLALARQVAVWYVRRNTPFSLSVIGRIFERDHGTILHAVKAVRDRASVDPAFKAQLADLDTQIARLVNPSGRQIIQLVAYKGKVA